MDDTQIVAIMATIISAANDITFYLTDQYSGPGPKTYAEAVDDAIKILRETHSQLTHK